MDIAAIGLWPLVFIAVTIAIGAFFKGVTGLGLPIFAIPAMAMFIPVDIAVIIMTLPGLVANAWLIVTHRSHFPLVAKHHPFLVFGVIGTFVGTWILANFDDAILRVILALWLGAYLVQNFFGKKTSPIFSGESGLAGPLGFAGGALHGATGISASVVAPYFHARDLTLSAYAFAVAFAFAAFTVAQLSALTVVDLLTPTLMGYSLLATVTTVAFVPLGVRYSKNLSEKGFSQFLLMIFVLIEIKLVYDIIR